MVLSERSINLRNIKKKKSDSKVKRLSSLVKLHLKKIVTCELGPKALIPPELVGQFPGPPFGSGSAGSNTSLVYAMYLGESTPLGLHYWTATVDLDILRNMNREIPSFSITHSCRRRYPFALGSQTPHINQYAMPTKNRVKLPTECDFFIFILEKKNITCQ